MEELSFTIDDQLVYSGKSEFSNRINETLKGMRALKKAHPNVGKLVAIIGDFQITLE